MANKQTCACPGCECEVADNQPISVDDSVYCCEACATGHKNGEPCQQEGCSCGG
jgi:hypothetical protein